MNLNLLFLVTEEWYFKSHRLDLARRLAEKGYEVSVACRRDKRTIADHTDGIRYIALPFRRSFNRPFHDLASVFVIARLVLKNRPTIVHAVAVKPILLSCLAVFLCRNVQFVLAFAGMGYMYTTNGGKSRILCGLLNAVLRFVIKRPNAKVLVQNVDDEALIREIVDGAEVEIELIPGSGIDTDVFYPNSSGNLSKTLVVVFAGRILRDKGVQEFLRAAELIAETNPGVQFRLAGRIDTENPSSLSEEELLSLISNNRAKIEWLGHVPNMAEFFTSADIVCLPSYREGLPKVLIEAASCGRAMVASDVPGCKEICKDGITGILVPPQDAASLANAISELLMNENKRKEFGENARRMAEREFSLDVIATRTDAFYRRTIAS